MRQFLHLLYRKLHLLLSEERGQDLVEYALIVALISFCAVASMRTLATTISTTFTNINTLLGSTVT
jgi:pilus assembly protein Flp/PilA